MENLPQTPAGPGAGAWYALIAALVLAVYAILGKGFTGPDWLGKPALPDLGRRGRILVGCLAAAVGVASLELYQFADYLTYTQEVNQETSGKSASDLGVAYTMLFDDARGNAKKRCYLENVISARVLATEDDPPNIPANVLAEIRHEFAQPGAGTCYASLAQDLANAVKLKKQEEFAKVSQLGGDPIDNRGTADSSYADEALAYLAPSPVAGGWIYLGKAGPNGSLMDPTLGSGAKIPSAGQVAKVEDELIIEGSEPDLNQQAPDVAGVYITPATVRIVKVAKKGDYAFALVSFVGASDTIASELK
jgi:hypothetical protein